MAGEEGFSPRALQLSVELQNKIAEIVEENTSVFRDRLKELEYSKTKLVNEINHLKNDLKKIQERNQALEEKGIKQLEEIEKVMKKIDKKIK